MQKVNVFESEWLETLHSLKKMNSSFKEFRYFLDLAERYSDMSRLEKLHPKVILLGYSFPDEIIRAMGQTPYYLLGGSFASASAAEDRVPRDTDSAIKSVLGMLTNQELDLTSEAIVLVPLSKDSMKKLPDLLGNSVKVIPYELPSDKNDPLQRARFADEIFRVTGEVGKHLGRRLSGKALRQQCSLSEKAAQAWKRFASASTRALGTVSGSARLLLASSYHWCEDKTEWMVHLNQLTDEILEHDQKSKTLIPHLHVMLLGSPVYAPNYKVPFLIEEMGLELYSAVHPDIAHLTSAAACAGNKTAVLQKLAERYLNTDMSPAFINNYAVSDLVEEAMEHGNIDGIVVHILKGQIEYDFELNRIEKLIDKYQLPVFRLETDYNYQDVEQLRIRLEAFAEMLRHRSATWQSEGNYVKKAI